jgi:iron-sulfur cluster repair protein YtfE (RIC family)
MATHSDMLTNLDMTVMYTMHDAFRRDLAHLVRTAARDDDPEKILQTAAGWEYFKRHLHIHHTAEDTAVWPAMREALAGRPDDLALIDAMEAEHARIDPLLSGVDASFGAADEAGLAECARALAAALAAHMEHEEDQALPLVEERLGPEGWAAFINAIRERQGLSGAAEFIPWIVDGAPAETSKRVLGGLPAPARLLYRAVWRPRYARTPRWNTTTA